MRRHWSRVLLRPRGPRSGPGYSVPIHQRLSAPSDPLAGTSRFRVCATIRDAFAVRVRLGDPRVVPSFHCTVPSWHAALYVPGKLRIVFLQSTDSNMGLRQDLNGSALPLTLPAVSSRSRLSGLIESPFLQPDRVIAPLYR